MLNHSWDDFYRATKDSPSWPLVARAAAFAPRGADGGCALDLGAGAGRDTRYLLGQGFAVTAVDGQQASMALLAGLPQERLRAVQSSFEDFTFEPATYDLISAQYALPFMPPAQFFPVFARIKTALVPGGVFAGQFFGVHDEWNTPDTTMTFLTRAQAEDLLRDLETVELTEEDADSGTAVGASKHWHVYHILARKPA
ncbi:MAG TPA: class I SAM-dependent methyltransferase [Ktedonobacterales bacterium]